MPVLMLGLVQVLPQAPPNSSAGSGYGTNHAYRSQEIFVRPGPGWKGALARATVISPGSGYGYRSNDDVKQNDGSGNGGKTDERW